MCPDAIQSDRTILDGKELDILIPSKNIAIEYCGLYWHSSAHDRITRMYHRDKMRTCSDNGIRLITLFENEWIHNMDLVKQKIRDILGYSSTPRVYARKTKIVELDKKVAKEFMIDHHIQGTPAIISNSFGLTYEDNLVAVMMFTKRKSYMELVRYSTSCKVIGGFSKLLKRAQAVLNASKFVSFADLRWSVGEMYKQTGWTLDAVLPPDYKYIEGNQLVHKFNYRHKYLASKLTNYEENISEYQNILKHNIHRIYDCGLLRYVFTV